MKLFKRPKPRIERRFGPIDYIQPTIEGFKVPTPPFRPKPSELIQDLRSEMPEPPIQDYEHFMDTNLYDGMVKQATDGETYMIVDYFVIRDRSLWKELAEWECWMMEQGIEVELIDQPPVSSGDYVKYYIISWGEN